MVSVPSVLRLAPRSRLPVLVASALLLHACAVFPPVRVAPVAPPELPATAAERHRFALNPDDGVVGRVATVRVAPGDTLPDIARHFGLGFQEMKDANPDLDMWTPQPDSRVLLPLTFILPDAPRQGIVINLASMRLFHFPCARLKPPPSGGQISSRKWEGDRID